jgi:acetyltransferase-like isoleucine patch superfamily enzyme
MRLRAIIGLAIAVVVSVLFAPGATANAEPGPYGNKCSSLAVSTTNPLPGEEITVSGQDFQPNASVRLELHSTVYVLKTVTTDANGSFETTVTLPEGVSGEHTIVAATGTLGGSNCPQPVQVVHFQTGGSSSSGGHHGGTSFTGVDVLAMLIGAGVLIGAGALFNRGGRRRVWTDS